MTPLPAALLAGAERSGAELIAWRLDRVDRAADWSSGEGARLYGGRWNAVGQRAVYLSLDPSTTILEKAVHGGFSMLDRVPHVMTGVVIEDPAAVRVMVPAEIPKSAWLRPGTLNAAQQAFGGQLLVAHAFLVIPSVVSSLSWNLVFDPARAQGKCVLKQQKPFELDRRLRD